MNLIDVYEISIAAKDYDEFRSAVDERMTGTPQTVISSNEFKLITVDLGSVGNCHYCGAKNDNGKVLCNICQCKGIDAYKL